MIGHVALLEELGAADDVGRCVRTPRLRHDFAHFLGDAVEEVDDHVGRALELGAQLFILRGDADRAGVEVALAHVDAAERDERGGAEVEFFGAEDARP